MRDFGEAFGRFFFGFVMTLLALCVVAFILYGVIPVYIHSIVTQEYILNTVVGG